VVIDYRASTVAAVITKKFDVGLKATPMSGVAAIAVRTAIEPNANAANQTMAVALYYVWAF
jgi:hypothetical protein